jgi:hypothetical protein
MEIEMDENSLSHTAGSMPPELSGSVPRSIRLSDRSRSMPVVLGLLIGVTVVIWSLYGKHVINQVQQRSLLREEGVEAQAEITSLKRAGRGPWVVKYTFAANDQNISGMADVPPESKGGLSGSSFLAIRYLPSNPAINHPAAWEWSLSSEWLGIGVLMCLPTLFCMTAADAYKNRKLLVWGRPVTGTVTKCSRTRGAYSVKYEFCTETGELVKGSGESLGRREIGECIWILFLTKNPHRNGPYPFSDFCVKE